MGVRKRKSREQGRHYIVTSSALRRLLIQCQIFCSADCCRANAFELSPFAIEQWILGERIDRTQSILAELGQLVEDINLMQQKIYFDIRELESEWNQSEALQFFMDFQFAFSTALKKVKQ